MRERFVRLLGGFTAIATRRPAPVDPPTARFRGLLERFGELRDRAETLEQFEAATDHTRFRALLNGYAITVEKDRLQQEQTADDFNLLEVMNLTRKEIRHSMVLAWLLDHDLRKLGTHAQGNLGLRLFLSEFGLPLEYADTKYWVRREVAGDESIVDIEVACRGRFLIHIENKIWSGEGTDQTDREWADVLRRAAELNVSTPDTHALFLTPHGDQPANANFHRISWSRIVSVLEQFAEQAKPVDVKLFTAHYARALRRFIVIQDRSEDNNGEAIAE
jgi:hypothetical protein